MTRAACALIVAGALAAATLAIALMIPSGSRSEAVDPNDVSSLAFQPHPGARLPLSHALVDEQGQSVELGQYFNKTPVILVLDYLRCTSLCGVTLRNLVETLGRTPLEPGRDYQFLAISIDPRDRPADARSARAQYLALGEIADERGMHFLTGGESAAVPTIADIVGFPYRYDGLLDTYIHPAGFIVAAPDGTISRYVEGVAISPKELVGALADAKEGRSQSLLTRLLLLCHIQRAPAGRFTVPVLTAFTISDIAAALTLIALFAGIRRQSHR